MNRPDLLSLLRPQVNSARAAFVETRIGSSVGAMSAGAVAVGAGAIGHLAIKRGVIKRLEIGELVVRRLQVDGGVDRAAVDAWVSSYERAWRTPGTGALAALFADDATYSTSPFEPTLHGLPAIGDYWERSRSGPDEVFRLVAAQVAVDGATAVVRTEVGYGVPEQRRYRSLWVLAFASDGRVRAFEEWPFSPDRPIVAAADATPDSGDAA